MKYLKWSKKNIIRLSILLLLGISSFLFVMYLKRGNKDFKEDNDFGFEDFRNLRIGQLDDKELKYEDLDRKYFIWDREDNSLLDRDMIISRDLSEVIKGTSLDLDGDGALENFILDLGVLKIFQGDNVLWETPRNIWVDDYFLADSTNDGNINLNLSIWREGNFGSSKPFWVEENDMSIKNHFFVYEWNGKEMKPIWHSSNLTNPNCAFMFADLDLDATQELIVVEGEYEDDYNCKGKYLAVWKWNEWGFFNEWRSEIDGYRDISVYHHQESLIVEVETFSPDK